MKILYVEDDLSGSLDRVIRLFSKYLDEKTVDDLKRLIADDYGAAPDKIKKIVESTNIIEIADSFPDALRKIMHGYGRYACFIVDRNLFEKQRYDFREVNEIYQNYTEASHKEYKEREGDYLLNWLGTNPDVPKGTLQKFYFLSAYPASDVRGVETIKTFMDFGKFTQEQFFDKSDSTAIEKLKHKIDNIDVLNIKYENRIYLNILRSNLHEEDAGNFLTVLLRKDEEDSTIDNLKIIRNLLDGMLNSLEKIIPDMKTIRSGSGNEKPSGRKKIIDWLAGEKYAKGDIRHMDSLRQNFSKSIWIISSDAIHDLIKPTANTVNALVYAMKDVILWFGEQCKQNK